MQAAAEAAAVTMQREVAAEVTPPPRTDPKIAVMNLLQASTGVCTSSQSSGLRAPVLKLTCGAAHSCGRAWGGNAAGIVASCRTPVLDCFVLSCGLKTFITGR